MPQGIKNLTIVLNETRDLLQEATSAMVASGTATLETALMNVPQVAAFVLG